MTADPSQDAPPQNATAEPAAGRLRPAVPDRQTAPQTLRAAVALRLLRPAHNGQLLVAAVRPAIACRNGPLLHWHGKLYAAYKMAHGWYHALLPVSVMTRPGSYSLDVVACDGLHAHYQVAVMPAQYPESRLHVAARFDMPPPPRAKDEQGQIARAMRYSAPQRLWKRSFLPPSAGKITSPYGVRRTFNGRLKSRHLGADFFGKKGDAVWAPNDGIVVLAAANHFYTGNAIFLDHGAQLFTMVFHMSSLLVHTGQTVHRGQLLGYVGSTGRATGPHVHFGTKLAGVYVNPADLLGYAPEGPF